MTFGKVTLFDATGIETKQGSGSATGTPVRILPLTLMKKAGQ
ncbi:MAG TPA: hypothetical protein VLG37_00700 [Candidatus Saccharimonadales bacterium]|nr:hypothetical protein [Candidatus Saccharimonadales bacterium]